MDKNGSWDKRRRDLKICLQLRSLLELMKFSCKNYIFGLITFFVIPISVNAEVDSLGMPVLKGWKKFDMGDKVLYTNRIKYQVEVRGGYGRYLMEEQLYRSYQNPKAGTPPSTLGSYQTNCYEGYGSINCTTNTPIFLPGTSGTPGGIVQIKLYTVVDCLDKTYRVYGKLRGRDIQKRWKNIEVGSSEERLARSCEFITTFPKTSYPRVR